MGHEGIVQRPMSNVQGLKSHLTTEDTEGHGGSAQEKSRVGVEDGEVSPFQGEENYQLT